MSTKDEKTPAPEAAAVEAAAMAAEDKPAVEIPSGFLAKKPETKVAVAPKPAPKPVSKPSAAKPVVKPAPKTPAKKAPVPEKVVAAKPPADDEPAEDAPADEEPADEGEGGGEGEDAVGGEGEDGDDDDAALWAAAGVMRAKPAPRKQCTYIGNRGVKCDHRPRKPNAKGHCPQHKNSESFRPCTIENCNGWARKAPYECVFCKRRMYSDVHKDKQRKRLADLVASIKMCAKLSDEEKNNFLLNCAPSETIREIGKMSYP